MADATDYVWLSHVQHIQLTAKRAEAFYLAHLSFLSALSALEAGLRSLDTPGSHPWEWWAELTYSGANLKERKAP